MIGQEETEVGGVGERNDDSEKDNDPLHLPTSLSGSHPDVGAGLSDGDVEAFP
jgi:hypothetical protein